MSSRSFNKRGGDIVTIGEKIKYFRRQMGITQSRLAEVTGIHPVSIRKYETNKMQPQLPQIQKIAAALNVSSNALIGLDNTKLRLETIGDLMGIIIILCNSHIINIDGERGENNMLKPESVSIHINPLIAHFVKINIDDKNENQNSLKPNDISFILTSPLILPNILKWEKMSYLYITSLAEAGENPNEPTIAAIAQLASMKETIELELQRSMVMLDMSDGIKVKINPEV